MSENGYIILSYPLFVIGISIIYSFVLCFLPRNLTDDVFKLRKALKYDYKVLLQRIVFLEKLKKKKFDNLRGYLKKMNKKSKKRRIKLSYFEDTIENVFFYYLMDKFPTRWGSFKKADWFLQTIIVNTFLAVFWAIIMIIYTYNKQEPFGIALIIGSAIVFSLVGLLFIFMFLTFFSLVNVFLSMLMYSLNFNYARPYYMSKVLDDFVRSCKP